MRPVGQELNDVEKGDQLEVYESWKSQGRLLKNLKGTSQRAIAWATRSRRVGRPAAQRSQGPACRIRDRHACGLTSDLSHANRAFHAFAGRERPRRRLAALGAARRGSCAARCRIGSTLLGASTALCLRRLIESACGFRSMGSTTRSRRRSSIPDMTAIFHEPGARAGA